MVIRRKHVEALGEYMRRGFEARMMSHLREGFPDQTAGLDDAQLVELVRRGIRRASRYGVELEDDVQRYLEYMMVLTPDFDSNPASAWAGQILQADDADGTRKMSRIDDEYLFGRKWRS